MYKFSHVLISAAIAVAAIATVFVSCRKDQQPPNSNPKPMESSLEATQVLEKINNFFALREAYHANAKTDNGTITVEEARAILDMAINYEFSDLDRYLTDTELDTLHFVAPPVDVEGKVAVNDIINVYDRFVSNVENLTDSLNFFMILYPQSMSKSDDIRIVFTRGIGDIDDPPQIVLSGPFEDDDDWIWGGDNGKCEIGGNSDAAQELTKKFADNRDNKGDGFGNGTNPTHLIWDIVYENVAATDHLNTSNCSEYWLFYAELGPDDDISTYCIHNNEMNCYWQSIKRNVINETGMLHYSQYSHSPYRKIEILEYHDVLFDTIIIAHQAEILYYKTGHAQ